MQVTLLGFQIDHTVADDIDLGRRATEMCPYIKAIDIWLPDPEFFLPNAAAIF